MSTLDWQHATPSKDIYPGNLASTEKEEMELARFVGYEVKELKP